MANVPTKFHWDTLKTQWDISNCLLQEEEEDEEEEDEE